MKTGYLVPKLVAVLLFLCIAKTFGTKYTPAELNFVKVHQTRNFFNSSISLTKWDFTKKTPSNSEKQHINLNGKLKFSCNSKGLIVKNERNNNTEGYIRIGKLFHYAVIDVDVKSQEHRSNSAQAILALYKDKNNRIIISQGDADSETKEFSLQIFKNEKSVLSTNLSTEGIDAPYTLRLHITGRFLNLFRIKNGKTSYYSSIDVGPHFDLRADTVINKFSVCLGAKLGPNESVIYTGIEQYLSSGTGQADPKVIHYEDGEPIVVKNKIWLAMTTRGYAPIPASHQGIYSFDLTTHEWELTGDMCFDKGDGIKRPWHATDVFFDRTDQKWKFLTTSHGDDHKIYYGIFNKDPRFGITEAQANLLQNGVQQGEDPSIIYDLNAGKWRLAMCQSVAGGFNTVLLESSYWNGPYTLVAKNETTSSTGILIQKIGGKYYVFQGRGNGNYEALSYPSLMKVTSLNVSPLLNDRNIWPVVIPIASEIGTKYYFLTFDREQITGTYSYGNLYWYCANEEAIGFFEYD